MPCIDGVPYSDAMLQGQDASPGYIGVNHPVDWVDFAASEILGVSPRAAMQGQPPALSWWQRRMRLGPETAMTPAVPVYSQSRPFSRGAAAYTPHFGSVPINPIGAGIYAPYRLPPSGGPAAQFVAGSIFFGVQAIPTSFRMNPTVPIETVDALIHSSRVAAAYHTTG